MKLSDIKYLFPRLRYSKHTPKSRPELFRNEYAKQAYSKLEKQPVKDNFSSVKISKTASESREP